VLGFFLETAFVGHVTTSPLRTEHSSNDATLAAIHAAKAPFSEWFMAFSLLFFFFFFFCQPGLKVRVNDYR
jgi:hypothetical protein